ncbi:ankyrin repeat domain-containing protein [Scleromatobacter humisilvae]|uniref:Ankyrin repeat domain-containing protein n=1 Tax=Scleromatobacter humisilvae TaxID=2897159 RepID=A0A9X1YIE6_9BURK|nr:ankyrin repeat domain-containing protein [Scleromatobacter humisilvae]MCK9686292.1 ankyrin repeat domain-containing protein [Scleromatobacter humisilvae]
MPTRFRALGVVLAATLCACSALAADDDSVSFFRAVNTDNADGVSRALAKGFDPNALDEHGKPALILALQMESPKVARVLMDAKGIQIDIRNQAGETPLMMAALKAEVDSATALVAHGAAVRKDGWSPLHYAATGGSAAIVRLLLSKGAPIEARSPNGSTPLMMAARYGNEEAVDALLAAGADRTAKNDLGMDASAFAASAGRDRLAARLKPGAVAK